MNIAIRGVAAAIAAVCLVVLGLCAWHAASDLPLDWGMARPQLATWAIRSAGVAAMATGQLLVIATVTTPPGRARAETALSYTFGAIAGLTALVAIVCGFVAR